MSAIYYADEHGLQTLGLQLIAGRNFTPADVLEDKAGYLDRTPALRGDRHPGLGRQVVSRRGGLGEVRVHRDRDPPDSDHRHRRARLQVPSVASGVAGEGNPTQQFHARAAQLRVSRSVLELPGTSTAGAAGRGHAGGAHPPHRWQPRLRVLEKIEPLVDDAPGGVSRRPRIGGHSGRGLRSPAVGHGALGIVGTRRSYWVAAAPAPDRHSRWMRWATRRGKDIQQRFPDRALPIAGAGAAVRHRFGDCRESVDGEQLRDGAAALCELRLHRRPAAVLLPGQAAALWPALRAASIPPALATRGI